MVTIYIVIHKTFENTNVFYTKKEDALDYINNVIPIKYPDEPKELWNICEIVEGQEFGGDLKIYLKFKK